MRRVYLPLNPDTKRPAVKGWAEPGYQGVELSDYVGMRCDGILVVDCDTEDAVRRWFEETGGTFSYCVKTRRGMHFYYQAVEGLKSGPLLPGEIDLKTGTGAYVLPDGAVHPSGHRYVYLGPRWDGDPEQLLPAPVEVLERLRPPKPVPVPGESGARIGEGERQSRLTAMAGAMRRQDFAEDVIYTALMHANQVQCDPPLSDHDVMAIVVSVLRYEPNPDVAPINVLPETGGGRLRTRTGEGVELKLATWVWEERIPTGEVTILAGKPGVGKSTALLDNAAALTNGTLPGKHSGDPQHVLITATEDSFAHIIWPRFIAAGGDVKRMHEIIVTGDGGLMMPDDLPEIRRLVEEDNVKLLIVDPIISKVGGDTNQGAEVRKSLEPLARIAHETGVAVVGIIHFNKTGSTDPYTVITGSAAFSEVPRSILMSIRDPDEERQYLLTQAKNSFGDNAKTLRYTIEGRDVAETSEGTITASKVIWDKGGPDDRTAIEVMQQTQSKQAEKRETKLQQTIVWLRKRLGDQGAWRQDVLNDAPGVSDDTIRRAFKQLGGISETPESGGPARWRLPTTTTEIAQGGNT